MADDFTEVDKWIGILQECKQLSEADVKRLTERVSWSGSFLSFTTISHLLSPDSRPRRC